MLFRIWLALLTACALGAADMEHIVVHRDDTQYYITPWLTKLKSGELILTVREAHRREHDMIAHADPTARGVIFRSSDQGRTWSKKTIVDDQTYRFSQTEDVPATQLSDGSLLLNLYSWAISSLPYGYVLSPQQPRPFLYTFEGLSVLRSSDEGRTWSKREPLRIPGLPLLGARVPPTELPDGTLLLPVFGNGSPSGPYRAWVIRSKDKGRTWGEPALLADDPEKKISFPEPCLLRRRDGGLISMLRTGGFLYQSNSSDDGRTWSKPVKTELKGFPAHLLELKDGRILCTYGYRFQPYGVRAAISRDGGKTWDKQHEIVLRDDGGTSDLGYPSAVELPDGRVFLTYWFNQEKPGDPASEVRYIAGTYFRP
jgi:sialidase-1